MKKVILLFLSCLILMPSLGSGLVYTIFKFNQDEITKTICIQRKLVVNTCNGRCELDKSLKKYDDNEKKMDQNVKDKVDFVFLINPIFSTVNTFVQTACIVHNFAQINTKTKAVSSLTFRPPSYFI